MKRDKKISHLAKKLVQLSKDEQGLVTEAKVSEVLTALKEAEPRKYLSLLKTFLSYLRREIARQTAVVATPGALSGEALDQIATSFTKLYKRPVSAELKADPSLIAGVRIRVGDDVYDASVAGRLQRLAENVH